MERGMSKKKKTWASEPYTEVTAWDSYQRVEVAFYYEDGHMLSASLTRRQAMDLQRKIKSELKGEH
jgi:hypothetical protein